MLETMRAFAVSRLEPSDEAVLRRRHASSYSVLAARDGGKHHGEDLARSLDRLAPDSANLSAACKFAIEAGDVDTALGLVGNLWRFWLQTGRLTEGRALIDAALMLPGAESPRPARIMALDAAAGVEYWSGDLARAGSLYEEQLALADALDDPPGQALAWSNLGITQMINGDIDGFRAAMTEARRLFEELGDQSGLTLIEEYTAVQGFSAAMTDLQEARPALETTAARYESVAEPRLRKVGLTARAFVAAMDGDGITASRSAAAALRIDVALRETATAVADGLSMPRFLAAFGLPEAAAVVEGATAAAIERLGIRPLVAGPLPLAGEARPEAPAPIETLGPERYDAAIKRGRLMTLEEVADFIESEGGRLVGEAHSAQPGIASH